MATETCCPYLAQRNGSIESWLFHRDPYFMVYEVIPMDKTCEPMIRPLKAAGLQWKRPAPLLLDSWMFSGLC